ncbi:MAG: PilN domain-containing protein [Desulfobacterales bacterium]|nr:PilN domain-containing protein [Desulfobacterales bacterium]
MSHKVLGLEVGKEAVSAVLIKMGRRGHEVLATEHVPYGDEGATEAGVAAALAAVAEKIEINGATCIAAVPADAFSFRNLPAPFADERKIRQVLPYEMEPILPLAVDDLIIDFQSFRHATAKALLAGAIERSRLSAYLDMLKSAGMDPLMVVPGGYGTARHLAGGGNVSGDLLLLVETPPSSVLFGLTRGQICMIRPFPADLTKTGTEMALCRAIRQTWFGLEETTGIDFHPDRLMIAGGEPALPLMGETLSEKLGLPVQWVDPAAGIPMAERIHGGLGHALALAMWGAQSSAGLNFRRGPFRFEKTQAMRRKRLVSAGVLALVATVLFIVNLAIDNQRLGRRLATLDQHISQIFKTTFPQVSRIVDPVLQMRQQVMSTGQSVLGEDGEMTRYRVTDILAFLSQQIPEQTDVVLETMVIAADKMTISGSTDSYNTVNDMKTRLEQDRRFAQVAISAATVDRKDGRIRFTLKFTL